MERLVTPSPRQRLRGVADQDPSKAPQGPSKDRVGGQTARGVGLQHTSCLLLSPHSSAQRCTVTHTVTACEQMCIVRRNFAKLRAVVQYHDSMEDIEKTPKGDSAMGRVRFFAQLPLVREKVTQGYALSVIYRQYQVVLGISYSQFRRYVSQHVRPAKPRATENSIVGSAPTAQARNAAPQPPSAPRRFEYDPSRALKDRDKLI